MYVAQLWEMQNYSMYSGVHTGVQRFQYFGKKLEKEVKTQMYKKYNLCI